jgi:hypothetical protein
MSLAIARESARRATAAEASGAWDCGAGLGNTAAARAHMEEALAIWLDARHQEADPLSGSPRLRNLHFDENDLKRQSGFTRKRLVLDREQGRFACTAPTLETSPR